MYDREQRIRTVFSLSIPGVIGGVFFAIMGCYIFGMGISLDADARAGRPVPVDPLGVCILGIGFIFLSVLFVTGIVSYFGATVIQPLIWAREQNAPSITPEENYPNLPDQLESYFDDDDNPEYQE